MKPAGIVGALLGGIVGALVWGAVAKFFNFESGIVAWGVGIAVGGLSYLFGGRGSTNGVFCAAVAALSIFAGMTVGAKWALSGASFADVMPQEEMKDLTAEEKSGLEGVTLGEISWGEAAQIAKESIDIMSIIFGVLGIVSAFKLGGAPKEHEPSAAAAPVTPLADVKPPGPAPDVMPPVSPIAPEVSGFPETLPEEEKPAQRTE